MDIQGEGDALLKAARLAVWEFETEGQVFRDAIGALKAGIAAEQREVKELREVLQALLDWGRNYTSPADANSPHGLLVRAHALLNRVREGGGR